MPVWLKEWWPVIALLIGAVVIPFAAWAYRLGVASKTDLAAAVSAEAGMRAQQLEALRATITGELGAMRQEHHELSARTLRIETEIRHLPTADDIADLKEMLGTVRAEVQGTSAQMQAQAREIGSLGGAINRIEDHLLKRSA